MSLHHAAQHLAAQGRGPDRTLVHMSPREVQGLQALAKAHGGSLTVNPETGLAEAGFLDKLLPTIVGAGLMAATGGAAAGIAPWMVGAGVGGLETMRTGSLGKGLMAGLGAYGGAGLTEGLVTAGANEATGEVMQANQNAAASMGPDANPRDILAARNTTAANTALTNAANAPVQAGMQATMNNPNAFVDAMGGGMDTAKAGLAALSPAMTPDTPTIPGVEKYTGPLSKYRMSDDYRSYDPVPPNPYYQAQYKTYADGGSVEQMSNANALGENTGFPMANLHQGAYATPWQTPVSQNVVEGTADTGVNRMSGEQTFAGGGGISDLGSYSDGGRMLKGPGDGMSDSIPAQIGGKQPARLADGEFVVPADVVSHLGNGSTDAGAKQLYKMMDRIRTQRTGKKKQAPEVNPGKAMPA